MLPPRPGPFLRRRLISLLGAAAILGGSLTMAVRESRRPPTRGDVMRMLYTDDLPDQLEPMARVTERGPGQIDLAGTPRPPAEPRNALVEGQAKGITPGRRSRRGRRRARERRSP
jgi:hypothetical protein